MSHDWRNILLNSAQTVREALKIIDSESLRIALVGSRFGPGLYDVILSLDKPEVLKRLSQI